MAEEVARRAATVVVRWQALRPMCTRAPSMRITVFFGLRKGDAPMWACVRVWLPLSCRMHLPRTVLPGPQHTARCFGFCTEISARIRQCERLTRMRALFTSRTDGGTGGGGSGGTVWLEALGQGKIEVGWPHETLG